MAIGIGIAIFDEDRDRDRDRDLNFGDRAHALSIGQMLMLQKSCLYVFERLGFKSINGEVDLDAQSN